MGASNQVITIPLQGGLGNQLFQLAAGLVIGDRHPDKTVRYSDYWLDNPVRGETSRALAIGELLGDQELITSHTARAGGPADRLLRRRVIERSADDDALERVSSHTRVVAGYFQRLSYVQQAWPALRQRLASSREASHRVMFRPPVRDFGAVHYRLGDYVTNVNANSHHGATGPDYFAHVIRDGVENSGITDWVVVSDDQAQALELLRSVDLPRHTNLVTPESVGEWSDLAVLASARVCAISNSSFSWWGAFIGASSRRTHVVAPRPWFADAAQSEPALFPIGWERRSRTIMSPT